MFIEAAISSTYLALFKVFLIVFTYDFEKVKRVRTSKDQIN